LTFTKSMDNLTEAFGIRPKEVISLVGAGGKTTLMFALARELLTHKGVVITTTTTKILPPSTSDAPHLLLSRDLNEIVDFIINNIDKVGHLSLASENLISSGKLLGIDPEMVSLLIHLEPVLYIIVEADGAAHKPLKAPNPQYEPVIPLSTSLVIPVIGIDALGHELTEEYVFRSKIAARLTGLSVGDTVSTQAITSLMVHPSGIARGSPKRAKIIPFVNKTDLHADLSEARKLASKILEANHSQIDRVVLGQARLKPPVREVIFKR
jgi:probable selenium-dependent hydroxylase accessory protein YqeC